MFSVCAIIYKRNNWVFCFQFLGTEQRMIAAPVVCDQSEIAKLKASQEELIHKQDQMYVVFEVASALQQQQINEALQ